MQNIVKCYYITEYINFKWVCVLSRIALMKNPQASGISKELPAKVVRAGL